MGQPAGWGGCGYVMTFVDGMQMPSPCDLTPVFFAPQPTQPTCDQVLTGQVSAFLTAQDPKLLAWDPSLAAQLVTAGQTDGVDPRLMASIATLESGHGSTFGGTNNPFWLGPKLNFSTPSAAVNSEGITLKHLIAYGDTTVAELYRGHDSLC
jgi:hypothetical protein